MPSSSLHLRLSDGLFYDGFQVMSFSILVGLGLDYDIFLLTRIVEFRQEGYSTADAIVLAMAMTGPVIAAAGLIMAIAFAGTFVDLSEIMAFNARV